MYRIGLSSLFVFLLFAATAAPTCVRLSWTAPGDDGYVGRANVYDLRYSLDSAFLVNNFAAAPKVLGMIRPRASGTDEEFVVAGLQTGTRYYFALKAADEVPNWSRLSNVIGKVALESSCTALEPCLQIRIDSVGQARRGQHNLVEIMLDYSNRSVGGFDLLIGYDRTTHTMAGARPGPLYGSCGWEYFNYVLEPTTGCSVCPSGLLHISAMPELNNGSVYPNCSLEGMAGSIVTLDYLINNDPTLACKFLPIGFFWLGCDDNVFVSSDREAQWLSREVYDAQHHNITDVTRGFPGDRGAPNACLVYVAGEPSPSRCVDYTAGGLSVSCEGANNGRGDVNLNGQAYEIADAVVFGNYFTDGMAAFEGDVTAQVNATDINGDGLPLTVVDLVFLIRIITGDATPMTKQIPGAGGTAEFSYRDGLLSIERTAEPIGAIYMVVSGRTEPSLHEAVADMELRYRFDGTDTRVLIWDVDGKGRLEAGPLLRMEREPAFKKVELAGYDLTSLTAAFSALPSELTLDQNHPNPFNPSTEISFSLPAASDVELRVFNIAGQLVTTLVDGHLDGGYHSVTWDARQYASGVYFYRLTAGQTVETKKMVLLK